ncbi:MAG: hypothetical protein LBL34_00060 [Clostridiales bacterium]|jgi:hypothetical protein|nr:hypothetical protein [Clostridiales bacterium]
MGSLVQWYKNRNVVLQFILFLVVALLIGGAVTGIQKIHDKSLIVKIDKVVERPNIPNPKAKILEDWDKLDIKMSVKEISGIVGFTPSEERFSMYSDSVEQYFVWSYDGKEQNQIYNGRDEDGYAILLVVYRKENLTLNLRIPDKDILNSAVDFSGYDSKKFETLDDFNTNFKAKGVLLTKYRDSDYYEWHDAWGSYASGYFEKKESAQSGLLSSANLYIDKDNIYDFVKKKMR